MHNTIYSTHHSTNQYVPDTNRRTPAQPRRKSALACITALVMGLLAPALPAQAQTPTAENLPPLPALVTMLDRAQSPTAQSQMTMPTAGITISDDTLPIAKGTATAYTVVLDSQPTAQVIVTANSGAPGIATVKPVARSFTTDNWDTPQTFTVSGVATGTATITHALASSDDNYGESLMVDSVEANVTPVPTEIRLSSVSSVDESSGSTTITATLDNPAGFDIEVRLYALNSAAQRNSDYTHPSTFTIRKGKTTETVNLSIVDDDLVERSEKVFFSANSGGLASYGTELTIVDNDATAARIAFGDSASNSHKYVVTVEEDVEGGKFNVPITISHLPSEDTTFDIEHKLVSDFDFSLQNPNYSLKSEQITFSSTSSKSKSLEITLIDDLVTEVEQDIQLTIKSTDQLENGLDRLYNTKHDASVARIVITDNDQPGYEFSDYALIMELNDTKDYTIRLTSMPTAMVTITPTSSNTQIATVSGPATFLPANWNTPQTFAVTAVATGNVSITHSVDTTAFFYDTDNRPAPANLEVGIFTEPSSLKLTGPATVAEHASEITFTAAFDQRVGRESIVSLVAGGGTALAGADYITPASFSITIAPGEQSRTFSISITNDDVDEDTETFSLNATFGDLKADEVTVTIEDDDTAGVTVSQDALTITKDAKKTYTVVLDTQPTSQVKITPTNGTPAVATVKPAALTFTTSNWATAQTFTVTGKTSGTSTVTHAASSTDTKYGESLSVDSVEVTVENPDPSTLTVSLANTTVAEDADDVTVTATFDQPVKAATTVTFTASDGTATGGSVDYTAPGAFTAVFTIGQTVGSAAMAITDDDIDEDNETFEVKAEAGDIESAAVTVTITDNDTAGVTVSEESLTIIKDATKTYTVVLESQPTGQVTITPTSGTTAVATVKPAALTFTTSNWDTEQTFTVTGITTGASNITHAATGDAKYTSTLDVDSVEVTVENPPSSTLTVSLTETTVDENVGDITVTATFDQSVNAATTVTFTATSGTATAGTDFTVPNTFTGIAAKGQNFATATVTIRDDDIDEENETFTVAASAGSINAAAETVTITDDDEAGVTVGEDALTIIKDAKKTYTVVLESQPTGQVTITPTSGTTSIATVKPAALTFTTSNWDTEQTFTVTGITTGASTITHAATGDSKYTSTLDVDEVDVTVENPPSSTLTVSLTETTVDENVGDITVTATFDQSVNAATTVTFTATSGTATAGTDFTVPNTFAGIAAKGQNFATATVTIRDDDIDEENETFTVAASAGSINAAAETVTITDDDEAGVTVGEDALTIIKDAKKTYTVVLESQPTGQVTITPTSGTTSIATVKPAALTFTTSNWDTEQTFTVTGITTGASTITHAATGDSKYTSTLDVDEVDVTVENPPSSTLTVSLTETTVDENVGDITVTATFDQSVNAATTVTFTATSGTATAGTDFTVPATFTGIAAKGQNFATATVTIRDDDIDEENETFTVAASAGSINAAAETVTITDDDEAGVTVGEDALTIIKDAKKTYTVVLESQPTGQVTITPTSGTTAVATVKPAALTFTTSNWDTEQTFTVTGVTTGTSNITHAATGDSKYGSLTVDSVEATVENPPSSTLTVSLTNETVAENAGDVTITATLDQPVNTATTVTFTATAGTATAGTDYTVPATFTGIAAKGQNIATATVTIRDDDIDEDNETFEVKAEAGDIESAAVTVTITDNDTAGVTVSEESLTVVKGATETYTVVLESQPTGQVTITPTSGTTSIATVKPAALTFTTSNWDTEQTFTVTGVTTGASTITHAATGDAKYGSLTVDSVEATVENPPSSTLTVSLTNETVAENAGDVTITATLDQPVNTATTVTFTATAGTATAGTDYTVPATFTGIAAKGQSIATATVTIRDDDIDEDNETFEVKAEAGDIESAAVTVTITDNDTAGVTVSEESLTVVKGANETYTVVLESQPTGQVTITPTSGTTSIATVKPAALTFTTSNWDTEQTFTVTGVETGTSTVTHAASGDAKYSSTLDVDEVDVTVENPPSSTLTVSLTETTVDENVGDITVTATFDQSVNTATTVTFTATAGTATAGTDYTVPATFTGIAAKGQSIATATVTIRDDDVDEDNETFTLAASAGSLSAAAVTVTITDDDTAGVTVGEDALTIIKGATKTYTVVLESQPTGQVTITPTSGTLGVATVAPTARTFETTNWNSVQTFTVTGAGTGTSTITHAAASSDTDYDSSRTIDEVDVTVGNPDPSTLTVSLTNTTVAEDAGNVTVTATFDQFVKAATTVTFTATGDGSTGKATTGTDFTVPATFTAAVAVGQSAGTATVTIRDDDIDEDNETFEVKAEAGYIESAAVTVTITDNDETARVVVFTPDVSRDDTPDPDDPDSDEIDSDKDDPPDDNNSDSDDTETNDGDGVLLSCDEDPFHDGDWLFGVGDPVGVEEFADLGEVSASHALAVSWLVSEGVLTGTGEDDSRLGPLGSLKRWEMAVWLVRLLDGQEPGLAEFESFEDVEAGVWWAAHVERLYNLGVTIGCYAEPLWFCPYEDVTRAQMASFLVRAFEFVHTAPVDFADVGDSSHRRDIETLYWTGITVGCAADPLRYCPTEPTSRQQMASFVTRALAATEFADLQQAGPSHIGATVNLTLRDVLTDTGCRPGDLCPNDNIKRWEMAVWLIRVLEGQDPQPAARTRFTDIDPDLWWAPHVERLAERGITLGCSTAPLKYCPHDTVPRKQMASFLVRAFNIEPAAAAGFTDITPADTHYNDINALHAAEITLGCSTSPLKYCGDQPTTKAQMASFITRAKLTTQTQHQYVTNQCQPTQNQDTPQPAPSGRTNATTTTNLSQTTNVKDQ